jgi:hypothetical protein
MLALARSLRLFERHAYAVSAPEAETPKFERAVATLFRSLRLEATWRDVPAALTPRVVRIVTASASSRRVLAKAERVVVDAVEAPVKYGSASAAGVTVAIAVRPVLKA